MKTPKCYCGQDLQVGFTWPEPDADHNELDRYAAYDAADFARYAAGDDPAHDIRRNFGTGYHIQCFGACSEQHWDERRRRH